MGHPSNITPIEHRISLAERELRSRHRAGILWLTGLSGAGKSTLAFSLEERLFREGWQVYVLDGDNIRGGLNADLGFSHADRTENIRRVGQVAVLLADAGFLCISAFISPYRADRERARAAAGGRFHEVYVRADLATCERRDPKGLYRRARAGQMSAFTAIDDVYEVPQSPELVVDTTIDTAETSLAVLADYVSANFQVASSTAAALSQART